MHIPTELQPRYRNRKGTLSQNVLAVCNFDMQFVYILAGWEGSAHDSRVLSDAQASQGFSTPKGKYWLGDVGYGNSKFVLSPYRGVRYHLKEVRQADQRPENAKELFAQLEVAGIKCDFREPNVIRAAPAPLYNTFHEVWRLANILAPHDSGAV